MIPAATTGDFEAVVADVSRRTGLSFSGSRKPWLRSALRAAVDGAPETENWMVEALDDDVTFDRLCDQVTVQESFFFREQTRLSLLRDKVLPDLRDRRDPILVWSAGCASGEEAYTLSIMLQEAGFGGRYRVLGTDLSAAAVASAKTGLYTRWSLRGLDDSQVARYFTVDASRFRVRDSFRAGVSFERHNLLDSVPGPAGGFDIVFCRNVLIYLTPTATLQAVSVLRSALAPGGWLMTSASDPLLDDADGLAPVMTEHGLAYRLTAAKSADAPPVRRLLNRVPPPSPKRADTPPVRLIPAPTPVSFSVDQLLDEGERALELAEPGRAKAIAHRVLQEGPTAAGHGLLIRAVAAERRLEPACQAAAAAVAAFPLDGHIRYLHAVVLLELGRHEESAAEARVAVYLEPALAAAHLTLGRCLDILGDQASAQRCRRAGLRLLAVGTG